MNHWLRRAGVFGITIGASVLTFELLLLAQPPGWQSREHLAIGVWSIPLGLIVLGVGAPLRRFFRNRSPGLRAAVVGLGAVGVAFIWTVGAVALTGGYALAFDANPLWCWFIGSLAGLGATLFWRQGARPSDLDVAAT